MNKVQLIIPTRNEVSNIEKLVKRIDQALKRARISYSLIFVDGNSSDGTPLKISELQKIFPIQLYTQRGNGKAQAILEGASYATSEYVLMIDADLQYPPEAIPGMIAQIPSNQVVVARRTKNNEKFLRKLLSKIHAYIFGQLLFGLNCDIQSGLKLFPKELIRYIDRSNITPWTLDLSLLYTAKQLGYAIGEVPIVFEERVAGSSKVNILRSIYEHIYTAVRIKLLSKKSIVLLPDKIQ